MKEDTALQIARMSNSTNGKIKAKREALRSAQSEGVTTLEYLRAALLLRLEASGPVAVKSWLDKSEG